MEQVKNEKTFFEVFPTLRANGELKMLFQDVEVKKITTNSTREFLHIHMVSHHLIPKKVIWKMEQSIKEQLFGTASVAIQIEEFYVLSELYTLETLLAEYKESLVLELEKKVYWQPVCLNRQSCISKGKNRMCRAFRQHCFGRKERIYRDASGRGTEPQIWDAGGNPCTLPGAGGKSEPGI